MFTFCPQVILSSLSEQSERLFHSTVLQWPCNAILYAGPSGQLLYTISFELGLKGPAQHFSPGLLWKTWERSGDDSVFITEGHLHTRLFLVLRCPSQVDLTGQHRPVTSWIMHYGHILYSTLSYLVAALFYSSRAGLFFKVQLLFSLKCDTLTCNTVDHKMQCI